MIYKEDVGKGGWLEENVKEEVVWERIRILDKKRLRTPGINSRNRFRQAGIRFLGSLKGLQILALEVKKMFVDTQSRKGAHIHVLGWKGQCCEEGYFSEKSKNMR